MRMNSIAFAAALLAASAPCWAQDIVKFRDPKRQQLEGEITTLNYKQLICELIQENIRTPQPADPKEVLEIHVDKNKQTFDYGQAEAAMNNGSYVDAAERFDKVRRDGRARDLLKQTAAINVVRCWWAVGDVARALAAIGTLRQDKPDSFYLRESFEIEIKCHLRKNDVASASKAVDGLDDRGRLDGFPEWRKTADVLRGDLLELKGDFRGAIAIHKKYVKDRDVGEDATLGELRCMRALNDWNGLGTRSEGLLAELKNKKDGSRRIMMAAYNGRGEVKLNQGKAKDALLDFMQGVEVLKAGDPSREHETSLGRASIACAAHATAEKDKAQKELFRNRALELLGELSKNYPGSPLIKDAKAAIDAIK